MSNFESELTYTRAVTTADGAQLGPGVALYFNHLETMGPDYVTLGLGRVAGKLVDQTKEGRIYEAGVGTGAFLVSAALNSKRSTVEGLHLTGNDISAYALRTTEYNLEELCRRRGLVLTTDLRQGNWQQLLVDPEHLTANQAIVHFNPPFKTPDDYIGTEGGAAPASAIYATPNEAGFPDVYEKFLPGLYRQLAADGVALVRLPSGAHEVFDPVGFDEYIADIQQKVFDELGLRYSKLWVDVPEKTPVAWDDPRGKRIPYRAAACLIVGRALPEFCTANREFISNNETVIYEDIQVRVRAISSQAASTLVRHA